MVVNADGALPLPWLAVPLQAALRQRGHALLLHGAAGNGTLALALTLAQAWLCEGNAAPAPPCGRCASCRLVQSHLHPDLFVLLPQTQRLAFAWPLVDDKPDDEKKKPSRQIRIGEIRAATDWVTKTSARGRGKVVLLHPAEAINPQAANALLKTLEEPPPGTRIVLTAGDPEHLLPTVRSRCQRLAVGAPPPDEAARWLAAQGVVDAAVLLAASSGRPLDAQALAQAGIDAAAWQGLPRAVARGQGGPIGVLASLGVPAAVDALLKLCHDALATAAGGGARFFPPAAMPATQRIAPLLAWRDALLRVARNDDHPWNEGLLLDSLLAQGRAALTLAP